MCLGPLCPGWALVPRPLGCALTSHLCRRASAPAVGVPRLGGGPFPGSALALRIAPITPGGRAAPQLGRSESAAAQARYAPGAADLYSPAGMRPRASNMKKAALRTIATIGDPSPPAAVAAGAAAATRRRLNPRRYPSGQMGYRRTAMRRAVGVADPRVQPRPLFSQTVRLHRSRGR